MKEEGEIEGDYIKERVQLKSGLRLVPGALVHKWHYGLEPP